MFTSDNTQHCELRTDYLLEGLYGGPLLCAKAAEFLIFYDWVSAKIVRRIDISCKKIYWSDNQNYVCVVANDDFYVLEFRKETLAMLGNSAEGVEESF